MRRGLAAGTLSVFEAPYSSSCLDEEVFSEVRMHGPTTQVYAQCCPARWHTLLTALKLPTPMIISATGGGGCTCFLRPIE
jgi:hypothetical protein